MHTGHIIINFDYLLKIRLLLFASPYVCLYICYYYVLPFRQVTIGIGYRLHTYTGYCCRCCTLSNLTADRHDNRKFLCFPFVVIHFVSLLLFSFRFFYSIRLKYSWCSYTNCLFIYFSISFHTATGPSAQPKWKGNNWRRRNKFSAKTIKKKLMWMEKEATQFH